MRTARRLLAALAVLTLGGLVLAGPASAAPAVSTNALGGLTLSALVVSGVQSLAIPIITGVLTKLRTYAWIKAAVALALSTGNGLLVTAAYAADGTATVSREALVLALFSFVVQLTSYLGVYAQTPIPKALFPERGLGPVARSSSWH